MISADWTPHRREDRELLGWIRPDGDDWVAIDLLGRETSPGGDWLDAEDALERIGLAWLSEVWMLETPDGAVRVRIAEVVPPSTVGERGRVVVHTDHFGAVDAPFSVIELAWPAPSSLRPRRRGEATELSAL